MSLNFMANCAVHYTLQYTLVYGLTHLTICFSIAPVIVILVLDSRLSVTIWTLELHIGLALVSRASYGKNPRDMWPALYVQYIYEYRIYHISLFFGQKYLAFSRRYQSLPSKFRVTAGVGDE